MSNGTKKKNLVSLILIGLFSLNILAWLEVYNLNQSQFLEVNFFDIGQGDAIFIETPQAHQILIDGGPSSAIILEKLAKEMPFWDRTIDLIILTHPDLDHLRGLLEVLKRYKVENVLWTGVIRDILEVKEWQELIRKEKSPIFIARAGQLIRAGGARFKILFPFENLEGQKFKNLNNTSIVNKIVFGENSFLFTGDIYKSVERDLIDEYSCSNLCEFAILDSDVLKISHQGSKTSTAEEFIEEVSPEIAVISVGKDNPYGHPHQEVLERLSKYDITVLRTDRDGDIKIISDGNNFKITND